VTDKINVDENQNSKVKSQTINGFDGLSSYKRSMSVTRQVFTQLQTFTL